MSDEQSSCKRQPLVQYRDETEAVGCPYGEVQRVVTGGEGGVANVHVVSVTVGERHSHKAYDEVYYVLKGTGTLGLNDEEYALRPGAVVVIPAETPHELRAATGDRLEFIIFGYPAMSVQDERFLPQPHPPSQDSTV